DVVGAELVDGAAGLRALAERLLLAEVDRLARLGLAPCGLAEVELELPVVDLVVADEADLGGEGPPRLRAEAFERTDPLVAQERLDLGELERASARDLADRKAAAFAHSGNAGARVAAVVLLDDAAAVRARLVKSRVVAGDRVAVVFLGLLDDPLGHLGDPLHERAALEVALLHLCELVLPLAGQLWLGQVLDAEPAQQRHQLERLRARNELAALAV